MGKALGAERVAQVLKTSLAREVYFYLFGILYIAFSMIGGRGSMIFAVMGVFSLAAGLSIRLGLPLWVRKYLTIASSSLYSFSFLVLSVTSLYIYGLTVLGVVSALLFTLLFILSLIFLYYSLERSPTP